MFRDRRQRHGVRPGQLRHPFGAAGEMGQDPPPGGIGQRGERSIESRGRIFNHLVKYVNEAEGKQEEIFGTAPLRFFEIAIRNRPD